MTDCKNLDLAREWAATVRDGVNVGPNKDRVRAAADVVASLPDEWVDADELRKYIADWREGLATAPRGNYEGEMLDDLEDMLPAPPAPKKRTLADMTPEEQEACRGMQAEVLGMQMWLIVCKDPTREGWWIVTTRSGRTEFRPSLHIVPLPKLPRMQWPGNEPEDDVAAATGGELTTQDVVDECRAVRKERAAAESASPRPEDVPEFNPAYTYSDRHGDVWRYEEEEWWCYQQHYRTFRANGTPPAKYGPYTRIEDTNE